MIIKPKWSNRGYYVAIALIAIFVFLFNWNFVIKHPVNMYDAGVSTHLIYSNQILRDWILGDGYISHVGLFFDEPTPQFPNGSHYLSTGFVNFFPYLLQQIAYSSTGNIQVYWMVVYSMTLTLIVSIMIGFLAFSVSSKHVDGLMNKLIISVSPMLVFQTMPMTLMYYWGYTPQLHFALFGLMLIFVLVNFENKNSYYFLISCLVLLALSSEYVATFFLCAFTVFLLLVTRKNNSVEIFKIFAAIIIGLMVYLALKYLQHELIKLNYPNMGFSGSSFVTRSWLDGDYSFIQSWFDVFTKKHTGMSYGNTSGTIELLFWRKLLIVGGCVFLYMLFNYKAIFIEAYFSSCVLLLTYIFYCLIFPQAIVLHSDFYEILLMMPVFIMIFTMLPMLLIVKQKNNPFIGLLFLMFAVGYSINSLRFYFNNFKLVA